MNIINYGEKLRRETESGMANDLDFGSQLSSLGALAWAWIEPELD